MEHGERQANTRLSEEAQAKLEQFIRAYDPINNRVLRQNGASQTSKAKTPLGFARDRRDKRLPIPGSVISKVYKGTLLNIRVLDKGFEYDGKVYRTLSSVAVAVTGQHWNGYLFFRL